MGTWTNNDNLHLKFGTDKATATVAGEYRTDGAIREVEIKIDLTALTATETILADTTVIPSGVRIQEVLVIAETAAATGTAIDLGLIKASDRSTEIDYDGLLAAFPTASMNADGEQDSVVIGHTYVGNLVGTTTAYAGLISASRTDATAFTAGVLKVKIRYYKP
jgi:hypothetical protein